MDARTERPDDKSIGDLVHELIDNGKRFVRAEISLYKRIALYRAAKAKYGFAALAAALLLVNAGLIAALVGIVIGLAKFVGPIGAGLIVFAATGLIGYLLVRYAIGSLVALGGDSEEQAALSEGERRA